ERDGADGLEHVTAERRAVRPAEHAVHVWERLAVQQGDVAGERARLQRLLEAVALVVLLREVVEPELDAPHRAQPRNDGRVHFPVARELDQAPDQLVAGLECKNVAERRLLYVHATLLGGRDARR